MLLVALIFCQASALAEGLQDNDLAVDPEETPAVSEDAATADEAFLAVEPDEDYIAEASAKAVVRELIPLYQADYPDTLFTYRGVEKSVASSGCGAVCLSMVIHYFDCDCDQTPESIFLWLHEQGLYRGNGFSKQMMCSALENYQITSKLCSLNRKTIRKALEGGSLVIAFMGSGYFSTDGHYILIYAIDDSNQISVVDPNSSEKSSRTYNLSWVMRQASGSTPYIVCSAKEK